MEALDGNAIAGQLFEVNEKSLLDHVHTLDGGGFKTKDFRTHLGTSTAMAEVGRRKAPTDETRRQTTIGRVSWPNRLGSDILFKPRAGLAAGP